MHAERPAWEHLPNAKHIDWAIADVKRRRRAWNSAWNVVWKGAWSAAQEGALDDLRGPAWDAAHDDSRDADRGAAWSAAREAAWEAISGVGPAGVAAMDAVAALIAWDDCAPILRMPVGAVKTMAAAGHHPAILLLPAVIVRSTP